MSAPPRNLSPVLLFCWGLLIEKVGFNTSVFRPTFSIPKTARLKTKDFTLWISAVFVILFLAVQLAYMLKPHEVGWDEAVYLGMGKYIYSAGAIGLWEDIRPIGLPLVLGAAWKLLPSYLITAKAISLLFAVGLVVLVFLMGKKAGLLAAALLVVTPLFFSSSSEIMSSIPAAFFSLLAVYLYLEKKPLFFVGLCAGLAFLFRFPHGLTLAALALIILLRQGVGAYFASWTSSVGLSDATLSIQQNATGRSRHGSRTNPIRQRSKLVFLFGGFAAIVVPFLVFNYVSYSDVTGSALDAVFRPFIFASQHQANPFHAGSLFFYPRQLLLQYALLALALIGAFVQKARPFVLLAVLYFGYYTLIPNKQERFLLDFLPYICILAALGLARAYQMLRFSRALRLAFIVFCSIATLPVLLTDYESLGGYEDELIPFFSSLPPGKMLTMTPRPAAYSDGLFIPMYDNPTVALETYHAWKDKVEYVLYFSDYYPCLPDDQECTRKQEEMVGLLKENKVVAEKNVGGQEYILYRIT